MKRNTHTQVVSRASLALVLVLAVWSPIQLQSAEQGSEKMMMEGKMMDGKMMDGKMAQRPHSMQEQRQQILAEMKAQDAELSTELARIKSAPEQQKMELLIAVVNRMVEQRTVMHERMGEMMNQMMEDMRMDHGALSFNWIINGTDDMGFLSITNNPVKQKF